MPTITDDSYGTYGQPYNQTTIDLIKTLFVDGKPVGWFTIFSINASKEVDSAMIDKMLNDDELADLINSRKGNNGGGIT